MDWHANCIIVFRIAENRKLYNSLTLTLIIDDASKEILYYILCPKHNSIYVDAKYHKFFVKEKITAPSQTNFCLTTLQNLSCCDCIDRVRVFKRSLMNCVLIFNYKCK